VNTTTVGLDIAKSYFQVHGVDARGRTTLRRQLRRAQVLTFFANLPACLIGIEACAGAHHWARKLGELGHEVKLMPAQFVKAYVKTNKNDARDAEAICEAVARPNMRFVAVKTVAQQELLMLHRVQLAAWLGLVPRQDSSGGKTRLLGISKRGDRYLRTLLILGARSVLRQMQRHPPRAAHSWLGRLTARSHPHIAAVALANKNARIAWALLAHEREYQADYRARVARAPV
jgi:transposase